MATEVANRSSLRVWWPVALGGGLIPIATLQMHRWLPLWAAAFISFTLLFAAAGAVVRRRSPTLMSSYSRVFVGAVVGGAVSSVITYFFPWV